MDRDDPDTDAVRRFELYEWVLEHMAENGHAGAKSVAGHSGVMQLKRTALINAAIQESNVIAKSIGKSFPGVDVMQLVDDMRVAIVTVRLGGTI